MRIERHNIHERISYLPLPLTVPEAWPAERLALMLPVVDEHGKLVGYEGTRLSEIRFAEMQGHRWMGRMDIILINDKVPCECHCGHEHTRNKQYLVYPGRNGTLTGDVDKLSDEDREWALEESRKCWEVPELRKHIR